MSSWTGAFLGGDGAFLAIFLGWMREVNVTGLEETFIDTSPSLSLVTSASSSERRLLLLGGSMLCRCDV